MGLVALFCLWVNWMAVGCCVVLFVGDVLLGRDIVFD